MSDEPSALPSISETCTALLTASSWMLADHRTTAFAFRPNGIPSFSIRFLRVDGLMSSSRAAPPLPFHAAAAHRKNPADVPGHNLIQRHRFIRLDRGLKTAFR